MPEAFGGFTHRHRLSPNGLVALLATIPGQRLMLGQRHQVERASGDIGVDRAGRRLAGGDWVGTEVFYQAPLYPYFLGVLYSAFGHSLWVVRLVQAAVGAGSCALLGLDAGSIAAIGPDALTLAESEGLDAHARSIAARLNRRI